MSKTVAIVLSAGKGSRMHSDVPKQYMELNGKPVLYYTVSAFQCSYVDEIIIVCGKGEADFIQEEIVNKYSFNKVKAVVCGGKERYHSVHNGLVAAKGADYVLIHDGARPFVTQDILNRVKAALEETGACVAAVPVTDTIKVVNDEGIVVSTPKRSTLYSMQTPQAFKYDLVVDAYGKLIEQERSVLDKGISITDDSMVVEYFTSHPVKIVEGSYDNIKITTPKDIELGKQILNIFM